MRKVQDPAMKENTEQNHNGTAKQSSKRDRKLEGQSRVFLLAEGRREEHAHMKRSKKRLNASGTATKENTDERNHYGTSRRSRNARRDRKLKWQSRFSLLAEERQRLDNENKLLREEHMRLLKIIDEIKSG